MEGLWDWNLSDRGREQREKHQGCTDCGCPKPALETPVSPELATGCAQDRGGQAAEAAGGLRGQRGTQEGWGAEASRTTAERTIPVSTGEEDWLGAGKEALGDPRLVGS